MAEDEGRDFLGLESCGALNPVLIHIQCPCYECREKAEAYLLDQRTCRACGRWRCMSCMAMALEEEARKSRLEVAPEKALECFVHEEHDEDYPSRIV